MRVALWIANMLKAETLAGRKADGTVALPSHLSPGHKDMEGWRHAWPKAGAGSGDRCFVFTEDCEDTLLTCSLVTYNLQPPTH